MMDLSLDTELASRYASPSQRARVLTEHWVETQVYCPNCGRYNILRYANNKPVADFFCPDCAQDYELKSTKQATVNRIVDGAYLTMIRRLRESRNPSLFLLGYDGESLAVKDFLVIPKHFFVPGLIEKRKPLSKAARRAGWVGCNILMQDIPRAGKIFLVRDRREEPRDRVLAKWRKTLFLGQERDVGARGWLLDVMNCIERLKTNDFSLDAVYAFEGVLQEKHPTNSHIKDKIRQQLQILRNKGFLEFVGRGRYRLL